MKNPNKKQLKVAIRYLNDCRNWADQENHDADLGRVVCWLRKQVKAMK